MTFDDFSDAQLARVVLGSVSEAPSVAARLAPRIRQGAAHPRPRHGPRPRMRVGITAASVVSVLIAANIAAIRLVPTYAQAVSHAPFVGELPSQVLRLAGLSEAQVTRVSVSATSSGHTVTLIAASADAARTVLLIQVDGKDSIPSKTAAGFEVLGRLTDQYGKSYQMVGGQGGSLWFEPLSGAAAKGQVEVTLHLDSMRIWPARDIGPDYAQSDPLIRGSWVVGTTVTRRPGLPITLPAPQTVNGTTYTVTSIRISGTEVTIDWKATGGPQIATLFRRIKAGTWPPPGDPRIEGADNFLRSFIVRPDGSEATVANSSGYSGTGLPSDHLAEGTVQQILTGHGDYLLRIGVAPAVDFPFRVP